MDLLFLFVTFVTLCNNVSDMANKDFGALRLTRPVLEDLKDLKVAFESCYLERMTNDQFIGHLIAAVEDGDPGVWDNYVKILAKREEK